MWGGEEGEGVSARGRTTAEAPGAMRGRGHARARERKRKEARERKGEAAEGLTRRNVLPSVVSLPLPLSPPYLFPSFWILYRERYAKVCMHEGRSNGQESREFVRSTAARIRTRYSFLLGPDTRGSRRRGHVLPHVIVVPRIVIVAIVMCVAWEAVLNRYARQLPFDR